MPYRPVVSNRQWRAPASENPRRPAPPSVPRAPAAFARRSAADQEQWVRNQRLREQIRLSEHRFEESRAALAALADAAEARHQRGMADTRPSSGPSPSAARPRPTQPTPAASGSASDNQPDTSNQPRRSGPSARFLALARVGSGLQQAASLRLRWEQAYFHLSAALVDGDPAFIALQARMDRETLIHQAVDAELTAAHGRLRNATEETVRGIVRSVESRLTALLGPHRTWRADSDAVLQSYFPQLERLIGRDNSLDAVMEGS